MDPEDVKTIEQLWQNAAEFISTHKPESIRERNKIKVKLTNVKRFIMSHLKNY